jgi:hypothetical protein
MSALNEGLDPRAHAAGNEGGYPSRAAGRQALQENAALLRKLGELEKEIARLREERRKEGRLLRGLTKLVNKAHYNEQDDVLTITPIEMHDDKDVIYVWRLVRLVRAKKLGKRA